MFRLFLVNLIQPGQTKSIDNKKIDSSDNKVKRHRNRRIYERFDIAPSHLSLMNNQDIHVVRDLSEHGFSTEVSEIGLKKLNIGDIYHCHLKYLNELYETDVHVRWKSESFVGFEVDSTDQTINKFLKRLLAPLEIGYSLKTVPKNEQSPTTQDNEGRKWYQSYNQTDLYIWQDESDLIKAWQLDTGTKFIKWSLDQGCTTGAIIPADIMTNSTTPWEKSYQSDSSKDEISVKLAIDIFMAATFPFKYELIRTISG